MKTILQNVAILFLLLTSSLSLPAQSGSSQESLGSEQNPAASQVKQTEQIARAKAVLEKAVDVLCPGGLSPGSPRKAIVETAIDQFLSGKVPDTLKTLKELNAKDAETPPAEFLLTGFWFAVGDSKRGLAGLEKNAVEHPDYPGIYLSFAQLALNSNRVSDAVLNAEKAEELASQSDLSSTWRTYFLKQYYEVKTNIHLRRKENDEANLALDRLQEVKPNLPFFFLNKAKLMFEGRRNLETIQYLRKYGQSIESKQLPELILVDWLKRQGKLKEAKDLLEAILSKFPKDTDTLMMLAEMYLSEENFSKTLAMIERFERANAGETTRSIDIKGRIAFAGLSYDTAAGYFRAIAKEDSKNANNATVLALSLIESSDPEKRKEAQAILQQVVTRLPKNSLALASLGYAFMKNGENKNAAEAMRRVATARQGSSEVSWFLANWLAERGQNQDAIKLLVNATQVQGFFLYRTAARKLLAKLRSQ